MEPIQILILQPILTNTKNM